MERLPPVSQTSLIPKIPEKIFAIFYFTPLNPSEIDPTPSLGRYPHLKSSYIYSLSLHNYLHFPSVVSKITGFHFITLKHLCIFMHFQKFGNCQSDVLSTELPLFYCESAPRRYYVTIAPARERYFSTLHAARGYFS